MLVYDLRNDRASVIYYEAVKVVLEMRCYVVDAFSDQIFKGNPAAVCILEKWIDNDLMQNIAKENNLSETAFAVAGNGCYELKWFTPGGEIDLCGHATLATAFVIMNYIVPGLETIQFHTLSGILTVDRKKELYELDLPSYELVPVAVTDRMIDAIGQEPIEAYMGRDLVCVMASEEQVIDAAPNMDLLKALDGLLLQLTAKGSEYDCVTRSFAPKLGVAEDPVCGSGHCHVIPYWAEQLNKKELVAFQASERTGVIYCTQQDDRTKLAGKAALYSIADLYVTD